MTTSIEQTGNISLAYNDTIKFAVRALSKLRSFILVSKPGVGKTAAIRTAVRKLQKRAEQGKLVINDVTIKKVTLQVSHPVTWMPEDAKGMPCAPREGEMFARFLPFGDLQNALEVRDDELLVWFFDDYGQAPQTVQAATMQLFHGGLINGHQLPTNVVFVICTNDRTHRAGVGGLLEPVKSRFYTTLYLKADRLECTDYFDKMGYNRHIPSFWKFKPEALDDFEPTNDMTNSSSPRTWEHVAQILEDQHPPHVQHACVIGAVGMKHGPDFLSFLQMAQELPDPEEIVKSPKTAMLPPKDKVNIAIAITSMLSRYATVENFSAICVYVSRMFQNGLSEYGTMLINEATSRNRRLEEDPTYIKLMSAANLYDPSVSY